MKKQSSSNKSKEFKLWKNAASFLILTNISVWFRLASLDKFIPSGNVIGRHIDRFIKIIYCQSTAMQDGIDMLDRQVKYRWTDNGPFEVNTLRSLLKEAHEKLRLQLQAIVDGNTNYMGEQRSGCLIGYIRIIVDSHKKRYETDGILIKYSYSRE